MDEWTWLDGIDFTLFSGSGVESNIIQSEAQCVLVRDQCYYQLMVTGPNAQWDAVPYYQLSVSTAGSFTDYIVTPLSSTHCVPAFSFSLERLLLIMNAEGWAYVF